MIIDIKIPSPGESISEVELVSWLVENGAIVEKDAELAEIESDKASLPLLAQEGGKIELLFEAGSTVEVGAIACRIDTSFAGQALEPKTEAASVAKKDVENEKPSENLTTKTEEIKQNTDSQTLNKKAKVTPLAETIMNANGLNIDDIINGLKRIGKKEVEMVLNRPQSAKNDSQGNSREEQREKMSSLRKKLSQRLVAVKNETAMLTTFNEADMSEIIRLRQAHQKSFVEKHGIKLGFMSFFTKAVALALKEFPLVNAMIDGDEIVKFDYADIGIAVQTDKGLMVPVLRNVENMGLADIELKIAELAQKARSKKISIEELSGGTFTISNGGIFGSMLSTPIINPPQSGILGMHNIIERPVAVKGNVEIRPMMYLALSYDHRIIDGRDSVGFLVRVKELLEHPTQMLFQEQDPEKLLLNL
ncbi:MAG: 2-oxoglutarate dehydrogenase complex dihydrolipoyllysine-residue succinyltransferase [Bacteroidales bacterium]|nr:2-oxoglutarate dehydrogenase complex dihydrolipoyllysine-residue succinyltransferase [Bacteroidales bacterium]